MSGSSKLFRSLVACAAIGLIPASAPAQDYNQIAYYTAVIGPEDLSNSRGAPLNDLGAVLQQDRANFHRFGIRHRGDGGDPVFDDRATRARIPALYREGGRVPRLEATVRRGETFRVSIFICGYGMRPTRIIVVPDWIGDHSGCF